MSDAYNKHYILYCNTKILYLEIYKHANAKPGLLTQYFLNLKMGNCNVDKWE